MRAHYQSCTSGRLTKRTLSSIPAKNQLHVPSGITGTDTVEQGGIEASHYSHSSARLSVSLSLSVSDSA